MFFFYKNRKSLHVSWCDFIDKFYFSLSSCQVDELDSHSHTSIWIKSVRHFKFPDNLPGLHHHNVTILHFNSRVGSCLCICFLSVSHNLSGLLGIDVGMHGRFNTYRTYQRTHIWTIFFLYFTIFNSTELSWVFLATTIAQRTNVNCTN